MKTLSLIQRLFGLMRARPVVSAAAIVGLLVLIVVAGTVGGDATHETAYFEVKRGNLLISVVEGGSIEAVSETSIRNMVEGTGRIIRIVPEGTFVKKGDLVVELDSGSAQDQVNQQQITVRKAELELLQATKELEIASSQTNSDFTAAKIQLELAQIDLTKYQEGELAQLQREFEIEVDTTQEQLLVDEERFHYSTNLLAAGFETKSTADGHRLTMLRTKKNLQQATNNLWMFLQFDRKKLLTQYASKVEEAEKELSRVVKQSEAKMAQFVADLETKDRTLKLQQNKLERDEENLKQARILAPADGLVVYATPEGRMSSESMIEEGATIRYRQEIIKLPDTSAMKLTIKIHESHVGKIKAGQAAYVRLDPQPDVRFSGTVAKVALLPNTQDRWSNPNLKVYNTEILITETLPDTIKPGVSASAEIIVTNLTDVISVPVQAVTTFRGKPTVYLAGANPQPMPVQVGLFNTRFIQITEGLKEGDRVLLSPPLDSEGADIDRSIMQEGDAIPTNKVTVAQSPAATEVNAESGVGRPSQPRPGEGGDGATASRGGLNRDAMLKQWDKDGDGTLSETERAAMRAQMGNRSGQGARAGGSREDMMKQYDTDGDGQLSETERAAMTEAFNRRRNSSEGGGGEGGSQRRQRPAAAADNSR